MMTAARRRNIDPALGTYTVVNGDYLDDGDSPVSKVVLAIRTRRGSAAADPELGSRLHTIKTATDRDKQLVPIYIREALKRLLEAGEIRDLFVQVEDTAIEGRIVATIEYTTRAGKTETVPYTVRT